jgi:MFS family permease
MENPYASPLADTVALKRQARRKTFQQLWPILILGPLVGAVVGGLIDAINAAVSPDYFNSAMDWEDCILRGMLEGLILGLGNAVAFLVFALVFLMDRVTLKQLMRLIAAIAVAAFLLTVVAATASVMLSVMIPDWWPIYDGNWRSPDARMRYAWVKGSIDAAYFGAPMCVLCGFVWLIRQQARQRRETLLADSGAG